MGCMQSQVDHDIHPNAFNVTNVDEQGNKVMEGVMLVTDQSLSLSRRGKEAIQWPLNTIRRYGYKDNVFTFESGRRCVTGPGNYAFKCNRAEKLFNMIQARVRKNDTVLNSTLVIGVGQATTVNNDDLVTTQTQPEQAPPDAVVPEAVANHDAPEGASYVNVETNAVSRKDTSRLQEDNGEAALARRRKNVPEPLNFESTNDTLSQANLSPFRSNIQTAMTDLSARQSLAVTPQSPSSMPVSPSDVQPLMDGYLPINDSSDVPRTHYATLDLTTSNNATEQPEASKPDVEPCNTEEAESGMNYTTIDIHRTEALSTTAKLQNQRSLEAAAVVNAIHQQASNTVKDTLTKRIRHTTSELSCVMAGAQSILS